MRAGRLDRRVTLQRRALTRDVYGGEVPNWTDYATVWAGREDKRGREEFEAGAVRGEAQAVFRLRHRPDVRVEDRVLDAGTIWDVISVAEVGRRDMLELAAKRAQP